MSDSSRPASLDVLVVDDDQELRAAIFRRISERGFRAQQAPAADALDSLQRRAFDLAVLDLARPGAAGLELLQALARRHADCEVILLTAAEGAESGTAKTNLGDVDYLRKPFPLQELDALLERAARRRRMAKENRQLRALLERSQSKAVIVGQSPPMQQVAAWIERTAAGDAPVLIEGESGAGKELVARAVHQRSRRADRPLVVLDCLTMSDELLQRELFGCEQDAAQEASPPKAGLLELADDSTLLLNEISQLSPAIQARLLRLIDTAAMERIGSSQQRRVDVRLLMTTTCDLSQEVSNGRFHQELFARLQPSSITLPPLRERLEDVPLLIEQALGDGWAIAPDAQQVLLAYHWPGNVQQLMNVLEKARFSAEEGRITLGDLPRSLWQGSGASAAGEGDTDDLCTIERRKVVEVLRRERGNKARAARALGIDRRKLYRLLEKYSIDGDEMRTK